MMGTPRTLVGSLVAAGLAVGLTACSQSPASSPVAPTTSASAHVNARPSGPGPDPGQANTEWIEVCKNYVGTPGPAVTFTVAIDIGNNGTVDQTFQTAPL